MAITDIEVAYARSMAKLHKEAAGVHMAFYTQAQDSDLRSQAYDNYFGERERGALYAQFLAENGQRLEDPPTAQAV